MTLDFGGWGEIQDFEESMPPAAMTHRTCGFLLRESEEAILVAHSVYGYEGADRAAGAMVIPRRAVLSMKDLDAGERLEK